ncbi:hypothetical protein niasHT_001356 [Heterodera trifolii]|uniref:N-myc downstream regulated n=1 Tax=Heterodera trifolii TaxID=157864 RepID=A0ABD2LNC0_9BILA
MSENEIKLIKVDVPPHCHFNIYVQEPSPNWEGKTVFLTVHDVGSTPQEFIEFVNCPAMSSVQQHSVFLHVCVPGQNDGAPKLEGDFPSMNQMGESLVHVLNTMDVRNCIGIGEGAGADILCRFAMAWPNRVLGLILIHCLATPHGIIESFKEMLLNLRLEDGNMNSAAWDYLFLHKFGLHEKMLKEAFIAELSSVINTHNLSRFLYAYNRRTNICEIIGKKLANTDVLLITGSRAPHNEDVRHMFENMRRDKSTLLVIDEVIDVLVEAPSRVARSLILFCKGFGELSGVEIPGIGRMRSTSMSMEEADRPTRKFSSPPKETIAEDGNLQKKDTCDDSFSDTFTSFILSRTSTYIDTSAEQPQNLVELDLEEVRKLQQFIGQNAINHIVVEDGIFAGMFSCQQNIEFRLVDEAIMGDGKMHRMLFSFGAILSAEIGGPEKTPYENSKYLRSLLKAYECAGGALKQVEKSQINDEPAKRSLVAKLRNFGKRSFELPQSTDPEDR